MKRHDSFEGPRHPESLVAPRITAPTRQDPHEDPQAQVAGTTALAERPAFPAGPPLTASLPRNRTHGQEGRCWTATNMASSRRLLRCTPCNYWTACLLAVVAGSLVWRATSQEAGGPEIQRHGGSIERQKPSGRASRRGGELSPPYQREDASHTEVPYTGPKGRRQSEEAPRGPGASRSTVGSLGKEHENHLCQAAEAVRGRLCESCYRPSGSLGCRPTGGPQCGASGGRTAAFSAVGPDRRPQLGGLLRDAGCLAAGRSFHEGGSCCSTESGPWCPPGFCHHAWSHHRGRSPSSGEADPARDPAAAHDDDRSARGCVHRQGSCSSPTGSFDSPCGTYGVYQCTTERSSNGSDAWHWSLPTVVAECWEPPCAGSGATDGAKACRGASSLEDFASSSRTERPRAASTAHFRGATQIQYQRSHQGLARGDRGSIWPQPRHQTRAGTRRSHAWRRTPSRTYRSPGSRHCAAIQSRRRRPGRGTRRSIFWPQSEQSVVASGQEGGATFPLIAGGSSLAAEPRLWLLWGVALDQLWAFGCCPSRVSEVLPLLLLLQAERLGECCVQNVRVLSSAAAARCFKSEARLPDSFLAATNGEALSEVSPSLGTPSSSAGAPSHWVCDFDVPATPDLGYLPELQLFVLVTSCSPFGAWAQPLPESTWGTAALQHVYRSQSCCAARMLFFLCRSTHDLHFVYRLHLVPKTCIGGSGTRTKDGPVDTNVDAQPTYGQAFRMHACTLLSFAVACLCLIGVLALALPPWVAEGAKQLVSLSWGRALQCLATDFPAVFQPRCTGPTQVTVNERGFWILALGLLSLLSWSYAPYSLRTCEDLVLGFGCSCGISVTFSLLGLLSGPLGWASSPVAKPSQRLCRAGTLPCHSLAACARPDSPILVWYLHRPQPRKLRLSRPGSGFIRFLLGFLGTLPTSVWAAPKHLPAVLEEIGSALAGFPDSLPPAEPSGPQAALSEEPSGSADHRGQLRIGSAGFWADAEVQRESLQEAGLIDPRLPAAQRVLPVEVHPPANAVGRAAGHGDHCACDVYVASPFYAPAFFQLHLPLPCEARDAEVQVKKHLGHDRFPYASAIAAVCPQPSPAFAAFVAYPEWATPAYLSVVMFDLRLAALQGRGPIIAAFVSRPTTAAEIRKEAGLYSMGNSRIYVGSSPDPLRDDEQIFLYNGTLIRLVRPEFQPEDVHTLDHALFRRSLSRLPRPPPEGTGAQSTHAPTCFRTVPF